MSKLNISDEQIERAAKAAYEQSRESALSPRWDELDDAERETWRRGVIAAAEHLQAKLEEPTEEDARRFIEAAKSVPRGLMTNWKEMAMAGLREFVRRRNAAMTQPVDPRIEILQRLERHERSVSDTLTDLAALEDSHA